jgi:hypothetical protein
LYRVTTKAENDLERTRDFIVRIPPGGEPALISCSATPPFALIGQLVTWEAETELVPDFFEWEEVSPGSHPEIHGERSQSIVVENGYNSPGTKTARVKACEEGEEGECIPIETSLECSTNIFFNLFFEQF